MRPTPSRREREEAALICAACASNWDTSSGIARGVCLYTNAAAAQRGISIAAEWLATRAVIHCEAVMQNRGYDHRAFAAAEALLRTGWTP